MYSMIFARTAGGSRGDFSVRVTRVAESPDFLWFPLRMLQVVLRGKPIELRSVDRAQKEQTLPVRDVLWMHRVTWASQ